MQILSFVAENERRGGTNGEAERHMSLNELAEKVGISNVNLSKIKNNKVSAIRFSTLAAICDALDCTPGDVLKYSKD